MVFISKLLQKCLILLIYGYRTVISGFLGHCCRFEPSCSTFAIEAIQTHGLLKGCVYTVRRLFRCHPWHQGGIDPVPKKVGP